MQEHKYPTAFPLKHQQKDMRLALELAHQHGQQLPTAAAANGLYEQVRRWKLSLTDNSVAVDSHTTGRFQHQLLQVLTAVTEPMQVSSIYLLQCFGAR